MGGYRMRRVPGLDHAIHGEWLSNATFLINLRALIANAAQKKRGFRDPRGLINPAAHGLEAFLCALSAAPRFLWINFQS
jgi:hypothetical protein